MATFPEQGGSKDTWGTELRDFFAPFFDLTLGIIKSSSIDGGAIITNTLDGGTVKTATLDGGAVKVDSLDGTAIKANTVTSSQIAPNTITNTQVATANKDGLASVASMRTLGTGALQACAGNDPRLSGGSGGVSIVDTTYTELAAMLTEATATAGQWYRFTYSALTPTMPNDTNLVSMYTVPTETLLVKAMTSSTLEPIAYSEEYPKDILFYEWDNNYVNNNLSLFPIASYWNSPQGLVYRRIDTVLNNDLYENYRSVKWARYWDISSSNKGYYHVEPLQTEGQKNARHLDTNQPSSFTINVDGITINNEFLAGTFPTGAVKMIVWNTYLGDLTDYAIYDAVGTNIGNSTYTYVTTWLNDYVSGRVNVYVGFIDCYSVIDTDSYGNKGGRGFYNNITRGQQLGFEGDFTINNNIFGEYFSSNTLMHGTIGIKNNTFGNYCYNNILTDFWGNKVGNDFVGNVTSFPGYGYWANNTFDGSFQNNILSVNESNQEFSAYGYNISGVTFTISITNAIVYKTSSHVWKMVIDNETGAITTVQLA